MIKLFSNILVALDFKETEQAEIDHAIHLAKVHDAKITLFSSLPKLKNNAHLEISAMSPEQRLELQLEKRREKLAEVAAQLQENGIDTDYIAASGSPSSDMIIKQVLRGQHDLLMIAERGNKGRNFKKMMIGSTARQLIRKCPCPVWAVHPDKPGDYEKVMASIDVGTQEDYSNAGLNEHIVATAVAIAKADNSKFSLISIPGSEAERASYLETIKRCLADNEIDIPEDSIYLELGDVASTITAATKEYNIDLLVVGMLSRTGIKGFFIGNTVEKVLDNVECSILTIKPTEFICPITLD